MSQQAYRICQAEVKDKGVYELEFPNPNCMICGSLVIKLRGMQLIVDELPKELWLICQSLLCTPRYETNLQFGAADTLQIWKTE
jgi:hypothetical protein